MAELGPAGPAAAELNERLVAAMFGSTDLDPQQLARLRQDLRDLRRTLRSRKSSR
jgi:hypothetical protein